ncbi:TniQ family protein [Paractinoplanes brasiliensis]|uniref:TniQ protein n=1 Tax=Paractinoplanes brasiliensis TaxID=52695 RepID=A0A4R6JSF1_9ACTN|nr:TniQ family protein [Actinoplanes brasiliensis]TDO39520.1 TniQ protein [Actinoplanes brasiliensis]GID29142.1 hypothetical protein Abr02nite_41250 [Actinoplanes brasiliensis]
MTPGPRTLPIRLAPVDGEALDSWLEVLADRSSSPLGSLMEHLMFPVRQRVGNTARDIPSDWTIMLRDAEVTNVATASGLSLERLHAMTLAYYDQRAVRLDRIRRQVQRRVLWGRARGSRYCPDCLRGPAGRGRWQLFWRLGWAFACPTHERLLADRCPECGKVQRLRPRTGKDVPQLAYCDTPFDGCGADLTRTATLRLVSEHPALAAQRRITSMIDAGTVGSGPYQAQPQPVAVALTDIRAVAARVLADLPPAQLTDLLPGDLVTAYEFTLAGHETATASSPRREPEVRPGFMAPVHAASAAVAVTIAVQVIDHDLPGSGAALRDLLARMRENLGQISATSIDQWGRGISPVLKAVHLAAVADSMRPNEHLRYRTASDLPARPHAGRRTVETRAQRTPSVLWPAWRIRLSPVRGAYPRTLGPILAACLMIVGNTVLLDAAAGLLDDVTTGSDISRILQKLHDEPTWPDIATALTRLADYLDSHPTPINYHRRRTLDYNYLLPHECWRDICRSLGVQPGTGRRERLVRAHLVHRISGLPEEDAPGYRIDDQARFRAQTAALSMFVQTPELAAALNAEATRFLATYRIYGEPLTWQPPIGLLDGLDLPGPDPARVDLEQLHDLVREPGQTPGSVAETLGTDIEVVRFLLAEHPAVPAPRSLTADRATGQIMVRARRKLPPRLFAEIYLEQNTSLRQMADSTGCSRQTLARLAAEYDIPLRDGGAPARHDPVDRDWLYEQYVNQKRPFPDLAREKGMSTTQMERWAREYEVPRRPRGGASHSARLRDQGTAAGETTK